MGMDKSISFRLANGTHITWNRASAKLSAGDWTDDPPESIPPGLGVRWSNKAGTFDSAVGGSVDFVGSLGEGTVKIAWSVPFIGDAKVTVAAPEDVAHAVEVTPVKGDEDTLAATVVLARVKWV